MKVLTVVARGMNRPSMDDLRRMEENDLYPRISLYERYLESDVLEERYMNERVPAWRKFLYRVIPDPFDQIIEAYLVRGKYDLVVTWAERYGYPFAFLLKLTFSRTPHITLSSWISGTEKATLLRFVHSHISRILMWSSVQRDFAIRKLGVPEERITFIRKFADERFWRPMPGRNDTICSAGMEMRDYPTLIKAIEGLDVPCHIAAGLNKGKLYSTVRAIGEMGDLPRTVTVGKLGYTDLRQLYANSRFVVIPLLETDTDNGLTCMLEAMSMGRAVICSRTHGQVDILQDGVTGLYVPQGNPTALREAILYLWNNPRLAEEMGRRGREFIERRHSIEQFVESVRRVAEEVTGMTASTRPFRLEFPALKETA